jgi:transaldolase
MTFFIDSANIQDISTAVSFGWVKGVTTNPLILARENGDVEQILSQIKQLTNGLIFYQLIGKTVGEMLDEAGAARDIVGNQLVVKVLPTTQGFQFCSRHSRGYTCCLTALYSVSQAAAAKEAGAQYIAVYYNRAQEEMGNGTELIETAAAVLNGSNTEIVAASVKSAEQAGQVLLAGAHHVAAPLNVLNETTQHKLSDQAITEFLKYGDGLKLQQKSHRGIP